MRRISLGLFVLLLVVITIGCGGTGSISQKPALNLPQPQLVARFTPESLLVTDVSGIGWGTERLLDEPYAGPGIAGLSAPGPG